MLCIAYGESDCNPNDVSGPDYGLFDLDCGQYNACRPLNCPPCGSHGPDKGCGIFQKNCTSEAFANYIANQIHKFGETLGQAICGQLGTLPCRGRHEQNEKTLNCLRAKHIDIFQIPAPQPLPGCPGCRGDATV